MTISDNLILLNSTKQDIKAAIEAKGVDMTDVPFTDYDTKIGEITTGATGPVITYDEWTRPSDWLTVPTITSTSEKVYILMAVNDVPLNGITFQTVNANITVDWGDGTVENFSAGSICEHFYDYNDPDLNGTLSSRGYKQALITITPQTTFPALTNINFNQQTTGYRLNATVNILEIHFAIANGNITLPTDRHNLCEYINIKAWNPGSVSFKFSRTFALKIDIPFQRTSGSYVDLSNMFSYSRIIKAPLIDTSLATNFNSMFEYSDVQYVPEYDYSSATTVARMFYNAEFLTYIGDMNIPNVTTNGLESTFYFCQSLVNAPILSNISSSVTTLSELFGFCGALVYIPDGINNNFSNVTTINSLFNACYSLKSLPNWSFPSVTSITTSPFTNCTNIKEIPSGYFAGPSLTLSAANMFQSCEALAELPSSISSKTILTTMDNYFQNCYSLRKIPSLTISANQLTGTTEFSDVFRDCRSLVEIGAIDLTNNTGITGMPNLFFQARSLQKIGIIGLRVTFTIADCALGAAALNTLYTNLATVTGQTITVTGNPGTTGDNPSIATAKGWTVVG